MLRLRRCRVEVTAGPDAGLIRDLEAPVIRIGARRGNDVQLSDAKVSGLHCEIRLDDRGYRLRALDSTTGPGNGRMRAYFEVGAYDPGTTAPAPPADHRWSARIGKKPGSRSAGLG